MLSRIFMLLTLSGVLYANSLQAEIYRWVDESGKVHFSDRPNDGAAHKLQIETREGEPVDTDQQQYLDEQRDQQQRLLDAYREEREAREEERLKAEERERQRSQNCAYARNRLRQYDGARLYQPLENGGRRYLDDNERQREMERVEEAVQRWCS